MFKYCWVWNKAKAANYVNAKKQPLKIHEDIAVFCKGNNYNPQKTIGKFRKKGGYTVNREVAVAQNPTVSFNDTYYPKSILNFSVAGNKDSTLHPTQKPVALLENLGQETTYFKEGDKWMVSTPDGIVREQIPDEFADDLFHSFEDAGKTVS